MAINLPGRGGGRFGPSLSDINVTPLVDVILVLLIIFMVTAPMMTRGIDVRLPKTESGADATEQRMVVTVDADNTIYLNERAVNLALLTDRLKTEMKRTGLDFVFLRVDLDELGGSSYPWGPTVLLSLGLHLLGFILTVALPWLAPRPVLTPVYVVD